MNHQEHSHLPSEEYRAEFYRLGAVLFQILISWLTGTTAKRILRRVDLLSRGAIVPNALLGDTYTVAACLDIAEQSADEQTRNNEIPSTKPGKTRIFNLADVVSFQKPSGTQARGRTKPPLTDPSDRKPK